MKLIEITYAEEVYYTKISEINVTLLFIGENQTKSLAEIVEDSC